MNIYEFADIIDRHIVIMRYANQGGRFCAHLEHGEIKEGCMLAGTSGDGKTPEAALNDYKNKIVGKKIVFFATSPEYRQEYVIPVLEDVEQKEGKGKP